MNSFHFFQLGALCFIRSMAVADPATTPFLPNVPGQQWVKVGYLNMTDPAQQCPDSWQKVTSPRASCEKKSNRIPYCDSVNITTYGASYQNVCGRFRGYQVGTPDAFFSQYGVGWDIERYYVDGVSITYGSPGNRHHVYTYAAGASNMCPCAGGASPPAFVGSDYYCESGNPISSWNLTEFYYADVLWDGQQCDGLEVTCCNPPNLPWFCKTFPTPISEDLEVRICLDQGAGDENVAIEFFELYVQVPTSPQNFTLSPVAGFPSQLSASWSAPIPKNGIITGYSVYCNVSANQSNPEQVIGSNVPTIISVVNGTTLAVTLGGLIPYTIYSCYVTANTSVGDGSPSTIITVQTVQSVPSSPQNLTLSPVAGFPSQLSTSWSAPIPKNGIITAYSVYCNTSANQSYPEQVIGSNVPTIISVVNGTTLAVTLGGLIPYTIYNCYVTANTSVGEGIPSTIVSVQTSQSVPSAPCNLTASSDSSTSIRLAWVLPNFPNGVIQFYVVVYYPVGNTNMSSKTNVSNTTVTVYGIAIYTSYSFKVSAVTGGGMGSFTDPVIQTTSEDAPSAPLNVMAYNTSSTSIMVTWQPPLSPNGIIRSYQVSYLANGGTSIATSDTGVVTSTLLTGLSIYTTYTIFVRARTVTLGNNSTTVIVSTDEYLPGMPSALVAVVTNSTVLFASWLAPVVPNGIIIYYWLYYSISSSGNCTASGTNQRVPNVPGQSMYNATLVDLVPFSMYALCVQASNRIGSGYFTAPVIITTDPDSPYPPANFTASVLSSTSIRLSWGYPLIPRSIIAGYQIIHNVSWFPNPVNIVITSNDTSQHRYTFFGLSPYTVYFFSVRAYSYLSRSNVSTVINGSYTQQIMNFTLQDVPSMPLNFQLSSVSSSVIMGTWTLPSQPNGIVIGYTVYCKVSLIQTYLEQVPVGSSNYTILTSSQMFFMLSGLQAFTFYQCYVTANTSAGEGSPSNISTSQTNQTVPSSPLNLSLSAVSGSTTKLSASWSAPKPKNGIITGYSVYCNTSANQSYPEQVIGSNVPTIRSVVNGTTLAVIISELSPFTQYSCYVTANTSVGEGSPSMIVTVQTALSVPSFPVNVSLTSVPVTPNALFATWSVPTPKNGIILAYTVYCNTTTSQAYSEQVLGPNIPTIRSVVNGTTLAVTLTSLNPYTQYSCYVTANTSAGEGSQSVFLLARTAEGVPSFPINFKLSAVFGLPYVLSVNWTVPIPKNGIITGYTLYCNTSAIQAYPEQIIGPNIPTIRSVVNGTILNTTVTRLNPFTQYSCYMTANTSVGEGSSTNIVTARTAENVPSSPLSFALIPISMQPTILTANWSAPIPRNGIITSYNVYCNTSSNQTYPEQVIGSNVPTIRSVVNGMTLIASITGLNPFTRYSCYVTANTSVGEGLSTTTVMSRTVEDVPSSPLSFSLFPVTMQSTMLTANWSAPIPKNGIITSYNVYCNTSSNQTYPEQIVGSNVPTIRSVVNGTTLAVALTGLNPFTQYSCYVTANTSVGEGSPSAPFTARTVEGVPSSPLKFSLFAVPGYPTTLSANWSAPIPRNGIIVAYSVYCNTSIDQTYPEQVIGSNVPTIRSVLNVTKLTIGGLNPYTQYSCYVTANTSVGEGSPSVLVTAQTFEGIPSGSPSNVAAITISPFSVNVTWVSVSNISRNGIITTYEVMYMWPLNNGQLSMNYANTSGASTQILLSMLMDCVQYNISVRAYTSQGPGPFSASVLDSSLNLYVQVPQPSEVPLYALSATSANLTWNCPLEKNYTITSYTINVTVDDTSLNVYCINGQNLTYTIAVPGNQTYIILEDMLLIPYTLYIFEVLANTTDEEGEFSAPRSFRTLQAPPTSPLNFSVQTLSYSSLLLLWNPPICANGMISGYMVNYTPSIGVPQSPYITSNATNLLLQNLLNNTEYNISLCAFTSGRCGPGVSGTNTTLRAPSSVPSVLYMRVSTLNNTDNHQNDQALAQFQNELKIVLNATLRLIGVREDPNLEMICAAVPRCQNDVINGWFRFECKILIFLTLLPIEITRFIQSVQSNSITSAALELAVGTQSVSANGFCSCSLNVYNGRGTYNWPEALVGGFTSQMCQYGVIGQNVTRNCIGNMTWTEDASMCPTEVTNQFNQLNMAIKNQTISTQNVVNVTTQLQAVVSQATLVVDQSISNLAVVTSVFTQISNISSSPIVPVQNKTINNVVMVLSSIQNWPPTVLATNGPIIVKSFEAIASNLVQQQNFTSLVSSQNQTTFVAQKISVATLTTNGTSYDFSTQSVDSGNQIPTNTSSPSPAKSTASVYLPPSLFTSINKTDVGIFFTLYNTASFFPLVNSSNTTKIATLILGVTVVGGSDESFVNLTDPVHFIFNIPINNYSRFDCVSWDFNAAGGIGNWTSEGCTTNKSNSSSSQIECRCSHLTNFAILVDISSRMNSKPQMSIPPRALDIITYVGVSLSLLGLFMTIMNLSLIKKQRHKDVTKYHIQLCCALFGMLLVFVIGIDRTETFGGCVTASVLIHYFTLVAVMWMGAEALFMFQKLVLVFYQITTRYIVILSLICWLVPLVPVIIPLAIDRNLLIKRDSHMGYCFISSFTVLLASFLVPILLVLVFNTIIFIVVMMVLVRHSIQRSNNKIDIIQMMVNITGIVFLFGLTWIFGAFTILKADQAFQLIFTVTNSFQGFLIFILFCVLNSDVRHVWAKMLQGNHLASLKNVTSSAKLATVQGIQSSECKCKIEHNEVKVLVSSVQLTHHKRHKNEAVNLTFQNVDTPFITEEMKTLSPFAQSSSTFNSSSISEQLVSESNIDFYTSDQQSESEL